MTPNTFLQPYGSIIRLLGAWIVFFAWMVSAQITQRYNILETDVQSLHTEAVLRNLVRQLEYQATVLTLQAGKNEAARGTVGEIQPDGSQLPFSKVRERDLQGAVLFLSQMERLARISGAPVDLQTRIHDTLDAAHEMSPRPRVLRDDLPDNRAAGRDVEQRLDPAIFGRDTEMLSEYERLSRYADDELQRRRRLNEVVGRSAFFLYGLGTAFAIYGEWLRKPGMSGMASQAKTPT